MSVRQRLQKLTIRQEKGQSMVELAITLPLLLLLMLGVVDIGLGFRTYIGLTNAAREGARWVSLHPNDASGALARMSAEGARVGLELGSTGPNGFVASFSPARTSYDAGEEVTVSTLHNYQLMFGFFPGLPDLVLNTDSTMVVLYNE